MQHLKDKPKIWLMILVIAISIISYNLWPFVPFEVFYKGMSLVLLLSAIIIRIDSVKGTMYRRICDFWFLLTINNAIDEFFFDPKKFGWNEYIICFVILIHLLRSIKHGKDKG